MLGQRDTNGVFLSRTSGILLPDLKRKLYSFKVDTWVVLLGQNYFAVFGSYFTFNLNVFLSFILPFFIFLSIHTPEINKGELIYPLDADR